MSQQTEVAMTNDLLERARKFVRANIPFTLPTETINALYAAHGNSGDPDDYGRAVDGAMNAIEVDIANDFVTFAKQEITKAVDEAIAERDRQWRAAIMVEEPWINEKVEVLLGDIFRRLNGGGND